MSFPFINIKTTNVELTPELSTLVTEKITPLEKFIEPDETDITCEVELEKFGGKQSGRIFRSEINLYVKGKLYRAEATEEQMEMAIDVMRDEVRQELRKAHGKRESLLKRGGRKIKEMMRFGKG